MRQSRIEPGPGQESVWDYPRPPSLARCNQHVWVMVDDIAIVDTNTCVRLLETSHPPAYYFPPESVRGDLLRESEHGSFCEWKGFAHYCDLHLGDRVIENAAWFYRSPTNRYAAIATYISFYPSKMDACFVDGERVIAQEGDFYGGWITSDIVGPFKGGRGTRGW